MRFHLVLLAGLVVVLGVCGAEGHGVGRRVFGVRRSGGVAAPPPPPPPPSSMAQFYTEQSVDHLSNKSSGVYSQRYYVNDTFFTGSGPVFLIMGGETPLYDASVTGDYHAGYMVSVLAPAHGALIVALEHRFYGVSMPKPDWSTESLALLSTQQALLDMAQFVTFFSAKHGLDGNKWVTFGGSYPGMLAAWSRMFFPHLIHASIASSAPVEATVDFEAYLDTVAAAMATPGVGGSRSCASILRSAYAEVGEMLLSSPTTRATLASDFGVCPGPDADTLANPANYVVFTETLGGLLPVQENDPACATPGCNIAAVCSAAEAVMANGGSPYAALVKVYSLTSPAGSPCLNVSLAAQTAALVNPTPAPDSIDALMRSWTYQTCTEYAFWQTCSPDSDCLSVSHPFVNNVASYSAMCSAAYNIDPAFTAARVAQMNAWSGGNRPLGSRVAWCNGGIDPWHPLSVLNSSSPDMPAFFDPLASHHEWTHVPAPTDRPGIIAIRAQIAAVLAKWLS